VLYAHRIIDKSNELYPFLRRLGYLTIEDFEIRIKYLLKKYKFISLDEYLQYYENKKRPGSNMLVFTIDDGYSCSNENILPLLKKYKIPATVFLTTGHIGTDSVLLHDLLINTIGTSKVAEFNLPDISDKTYLLKTERDRNSTYKDISVRLKKISNGKKKKVLEKLSETLKVESSKTCKDNRMLTWGEVREMRDSGLVSFGTHTVSHPILTKISEDDARQEIIISKKILENELNEKVKFMAYPNGRENDFNDAIINIVRESGYEMAFTTLENTGRTRGRYEIPRYGLVSEPFFMFALRMSGFFDILHFSREKFINKFKHEE
jgi:peptidoglycan/xylan/chitin deacetylase (PgdA/CDA1 family)